MFYISSSSFPFDILSKKNSLGIHKPFAIEFSGGTGYYEEPFLKETILSIKENCTNSLLIHNYFPTPKKSFVLNFASINSEVTRLSINLARESLRLCREFNIPYYSFHPGYLYDGEEQPDGHFAFNKYSYIPYDQALDQFLKNFQALYAMAREYGILLAVENLFPDAEGRQTSLNATPEELVEMMDALPRDVGILLDLGHLNIASTHHAFDKHKYIQRLLDSYGDRLFEMHLSANNGLRDEHLPVVEGYWQLDVLPLFANCPGALGQGVNVTLESRKLELATLEATCRTIQTRMNT